MEKANRTKKWLIWFFGAVAVLTVLVCMAVYIVDPFFQFRVRDGQYFLTENYVNGGIIKNDDYDTIIIGSCMVQNYDIAYFDRTFGADAVKIGGGGLDSGGVIRYLELANRVGSAENYFINVDLYGFESTDSVKQRALELSEYDYLLRDDPLARLQYAFSYEVWFRFLPVDVGMSACCALTGKLPVASLSSRSEIAHVGEWSDNFVYGEEAVMKSRENEDTAATVLNEQEQSEMRAAMQESMDAYIEAIDFSAGNYTFIFPPYSYLYWEDARAANTYEVLTEAKQYLTEKLKSNGAAVYDFQNADVTYDLDYYMDTTHYSKKLNDFMTECMASGKYRK